MMTEAGSGRTFESVALMFPGQGSQYPGMAVDLARESSKARQIIEQADHVLGYSLSRIMAGEEGEELNRTIHTQPAVFVHSMALYELLRERFSLNVVVAAGHSLGEYSALCAAGVLDFEDALDVIRVRAHGMDSAQPPGTCGMAAIVGLDRDRVVGLIAAHRGDEELEAANFNAPDQVVISGSLNAVQRALQAVAKERRTRAVTLPVSSAFHTPLMEPARVSLAQRLATASFSQARFPVVANVDARVYPVAQDRMRQLLVDQVVSPVLWEDCVETMTSMGATHFIEVGPGKVLSGILRRIDRSLSCTSVCDLDALRSLEVALA